MSEPRSTVSEWRSLLLNNRDHLAKLPANEEIYRFWNINAVAALAQTEFYSTLTAGEDIKWHFMRMQNEMLAAHAWTALEDVMVQVWLLGEIAPRLESYLAKLVHLEPNSPYVRSE